MTNNKLFKIQYCIVKTKDENIVMRFIHDKHINKSKLAEKLGMSSQNLQGRLVKNSLPSDFIEQLSDALEHDFFADLSLEYKKKHFNVQSIVEEPTAKYGKSESPLDIYVQQLVAQEVKRILKK